MDRVIIGCVTRTSARPVNNREPRAKRQDETLDARNTRPPTVQHPPAPDQYATSHTPQPSTKSPAVNHTVGHRQPHVAHNARHQSTTTSALTPTPDHHQAATPYGTTVKHHHNTSQPPTVPPNAAPKRSGIRISETHLGDTKWTPNVANAGGECLVGFSRGFG